MKKVATITLNPAYDLHGSCNEIMLGDVNLVETEVMLPAGKGINVSKVLHDLDLTTAVGGFLGGENSSEFIQTFSHFNLKNYFIAVPGKTRINVKLTETNGDVTDLNFSGFEVDETQWTNFYESTLNWLKEYDIVVVSGSIPKGILMEEFSQWLTAVKSICPKLIFDSSRDALAIGINSKPFLIKPNEKELGMLIGREVKEQDEIVAAAKEIVHNGIEHVVVSMGEHGAVWVSKNQNYVAKPPKSKVVSTVGAGDSMVAGIVYGLANDKTIKETFVFSSAVAALSVTQSGVGIKDKTALDLMLEKITISDIKE